MLAEIGSRALSPGLNDPGTAIDVIARQQGLLWDWANDPRSTDLPGYPRIFLREVTARDLIESAFDSIARDGAGLIEVANRLQVALEALANGPDPALSKAAIRMAAHARDHANAGLVLEGDKDRLHPVSSQ